MVLALVRFIRKEIGAARLAWGYRTWCRLIGLRRRAAFRCRLEYVRCYQGGDDRDQTEYSKLKTAYFITRVFPPLRTEDPGISSNLFSGSSGVTHLVTVGFGNSASRYWRYLVGLKLSACKFLLRVCCFSSNCSHSSYVVGFLLVLFRVCVFAWCFDKIRLAIFRCRLQIGTLHLF